MGDSDSKVYLTIIPCRKYRRIEDGKADTELVERIEKFLYDIYVVEQQWHIVQSPRNRSNVRIVNDCRLVDDINRKCAWIVLQLDRKDRFEPTTQQDTGIVACVRIIDPDDFGGKCEFETYFENQTTSEIQDSIRSLTPFVEANRFAVCKQWRSQSDIAPLIYKIAFVYIEARYRGSRGLITVSANAAVQKLGVRFGGIILRRDFKYDPLEDEDSCAIIFYPALEAIRGIPRLILKDQVAMQLRAKL